MSKKIVHLVPLIFVFLAGISAFLYYLTLMKVFLPFEFVFLALAAFYFLLTIKFLPLETKEDILTEGIALVLLLFSIPGNWAYYWQGFPYTNPILLLPVLLFLLGFVGYMIKLCLYFYKKKNTKKGD